MVVTLPFALLLLDYWPLQRFALKKAAQEPIEGNKQGDGDRRKGRSRKKQRIRGKGRTEKTTDHKSLWVVIRPLLLEKIPLFVLALLSSFLAYIAQRGETMGPVEWIPLGERIPNAFISYIVYLRKMFWPTNLAVHYPYPEVRPDWQVLGAIFFFITAMLVAIRSAKRVPYLTVGWLWYVGILVPVIGIVQVGNHAMADRYTYIPLIGLFIIVAWGVPELFKNWRFRREALIILPMLCILCMFFLTWRQAGYWRDSITLFDHVLKVTDRNALAYNSRGVAYENLGNHRQAIEDYNKAIQLNPKYAMAYNNRGNAYGKLGNHRQAIDDHNKAIQLNPKFAEAYSNRAIAYGKLGNYRQAIEDCNKAIEINSKYAGAYINRGIAYGKLGNHRQAIEDIKRAARLGDESAQKFLKSQAMGW
jgi:Tfp pilus assembly protein PilF